MAESLFHELKNTGRQVFFDKNRLEPGKPFSPKIQAEILACELFLITPDSVAEGRCTRTELRIARDQWASPPGIVLPVMLEDTPIEAIPTFLKSRHIFRPEGNAAAEIARRTAVRQCRVGPTRTMTKLVLDASVAVKWFLPDTSDEADTPVACELLGGVKDGRITLLQPPQWKPELAAVLVRRLPAALASESIDDLSLIVGITIDDRPSSYRLAIELSATLDHHLFDTLYHALALDTGAMFVTADTRYHRKATHLGGIALLSDL